MAFAVTNDFTSGTLAKSSEVNTNFADVETELNAFPTNGTFSDGAVSTTAKLANSIITSAKCHAGFFKDEDDMATDSATAVASQQSVKAYVDNSKIIQQVVNETDSAVATGTTVMPFDDTIPQNTEGDEYMTKAITPKATTNKLVIDVECVLGAGAAGRMTIALFQDSTANAIAAASEQVESGEIHNCHLRHYMTAATTSATTFKVRAGCEAAGTTTFNGVSSARRMGGIMASSINIYEVKA